VGEDARPLRRSLIAAMLASPWARTASAAAPQAEPRQHWRSRFEAGLADWGRLEADWGHHNLALLDDAGVPGRVLRVHLQQGGIDPGTMHRRGLPRSGTGFKARLLAAGATQATLHYRVRFAAGFDFVRGGKLPGLFGGSGPSGGRIPTADEGFSLRLMWRERGQGEVYAYLPTSRGQGTSLLPGSLRFVPGHWHQLSQVLRLNTPGRDDGTLQLWQDGREVGRAGGLRLRDSAALSIDGVFFDVFFGGNDDSWAPRADTHIDFADVVLAAAAGAGP